MGMPFPALSAFVGHAKGWLKGMPRSYSADGGEAMTRQSNREVDDSFAFIRENDVM